MVCCYFKTITALRLHHFKTITTLTVDGARASKNATKLSCHFQIASSLVQYVFGCYKSLADFRTKRNSKNPTARNSTIKLSEAKRHRKNLFSQRRKKKEICYKAGILKKIRANFLYETTEARGQTYLKC